MRQLRPQPFCPLFHLLRLIPLLPLLLLLHLLWLICLIHLIEVNVKPPMEGLFFFFQDSLIASILYRIWRWTAAPGRPGGLSLLHGPVPAPLTIYIHMIKSATASHHPSSSQRISLRRAFPSPTHEHSIKCAAFCGVWRVCCLRLVC